jgi:hypothetical protein
MSNQANQIEKTNTGEIPAAVLQVAETSNKVEASQELQEQDIVRRASDASPEEPKLYVFDLTATTGPRTHDLVDKRGVVVPYNFPDTQTPRPVPYSAGIRLIDNQGFRVVDEDGNVLEANKERDEHVTLKSNETIARYDQLKHEALATICKRLKAPRKITTSEAMINWLVAYNQEREDARMRADELGLSRSLKEIIADAGGDIDNINAMTPDDVSVAAGSGDPLADVKQPQTVAV